MMSTSPQPNPFRRLRTIVGCLSLVFLAGAMLWQTAASQSSGSLEERIRSQKNKLQKIEQDIKRHREESTELERKETNIRKQLSHLDKEISLSKKYLAGLGQKEDLLTQQIDSLRANIYTESGVLSRQKGKLAERLRQMYKRGPDHQWLFILGGENIAEKVRRYKFLRMVAERDAQLVREVSERKQSLELEQAGLTEALADIASLKRIQESEATKLEKSKRTRVSMLNRIRGDKSKHAKAIEELERSQERLKELIGELLRRSRDDPTGLPPGGFTGLKGRLARPVDGQVISKFGKSRHPTFGTVTFNNGIDIKAPAGSPVRTVAAGRVEFVDWVAGYGNCIIINHGGGYYTLYAHVADIFVRPDQNVSANEVIAEVGDTDSLHGFACHFEIRKSKQALNPMDWLAK
ncbi:MAG: peptidoglycan DD-metalloendopeptidase family protein [Candidatus Latescibacterota bacterium]|nr:MAG: peptidoglycan DD-metalloendopeptidase family protein [Candidatus Latescibacterota bacterium]